VAGTLEHDVRPMTRAQHVHVGMQLVGALDLLARAMVTA
jgi:hypothetical protein